MTYWYGNDTDGIVQDLAGNLVTGGLTFTVWDAQTGGSQITNLVDAAGNPVDGGAVAVSASGWLVFGDPTETRLGVWVQSVQDTARPRYFIASRSIPTLVRSLVQAGTDYVPNSAVGSPDGVAPLDAAGLVSPAYLPNGGVWDLSLVATADGATDDAPVIQAVIDNAAVGDTIRVPAGLTFAVGAALSIPKRLTITGGGTLVTLNGTGVFTLTTASSGTRIDDLELVGLYPAGRVDSHRPISVEGTSAAEPATDLRFTRLRVRGFGGTAMWVRYARNVRVQDCDLADLGYAGVQFLSVVGGQISGNEIRNVTPGSTSQDQSYGIALTRDATGDLDAQPRTSDIAVTGNRIHGVPRWEGIDTHGGERITIADNIVTGCNVGVAVVSCPDGTSEFIAARDVTVSGNTISGDGAGLTQAAITVAGANGAVSGSPVDYATGIVVKGNTLRGHGRDAASPVGAMYIRTTYGLVLEGNTFWEPSPVGIQLYDDNLAFSIQGNTFVEPWSNTLAYAVCILLQEPFNDGVVSGNVHRANGAHSDAAHANDAAIRVNDNTDNELVMGVNRWRTTSVMVGPGASTAPRIGLFNKANAPVTLPVVGGVTAGNTALQNLLARLQDAGLITNSTTTS